MAKGKHQSQSGTDSRKLIIILIAAVAAIAIVVTAADPLPVVLMWIPMAVQWISQEVLKRRMTAGDEEYRAPNTALRVAIAAVVLGAFLAALGTYVFILLR